MGNGVYFWKITKYDPNLKTDEWTAMSDVGKVYNGKIFELKEYLRVENLYLHAIQLIARHNGVSFFEISSLELLRRPDTPLLDVVDHSSVDLESALVIAQKVLREELWCKLLHPKMIVHFGYDYYMYIGSAKSSTLELEKIRDMGLFIEEKKSPYFSDEDVKI